MCRIPTVTLICVLACGATLRAQDTIRPLPIKPRAAIFLLDDTGVEHRGRFVRADDHDMVLLVNGDERRFKRDMIARIDREGDSLKNGPIIGVLIGAPVGGICASLRKPSSIQSPFPLLPRPVVVVGGEAEQKHEELGVRVWT
jgi:hypothetical protein